MVATYAYPTTDLILFYLHKDSIGFMVFALVILLIAVVNCIFTFKEDSIKKG
ncbi:hypothetical protein F6Y05_40260 [Bacillus megaterium]|nr:hypothetical protein [Priestia megaterium]